jgi:putative transposase
VTALAEMYVQGVSTRKVKAITEELCGHSFSAAAISAINVKLDEELARFARRRLDEPCPYFILDARYEGVREAGVIRSQAVLLAIGIGWDGRRSVLAVELANCESRSSWRDFLLQLRERGLSGVEFVGSDDHAGLRQAIREILPEAAWQRCYVGAVEERGFRAAKRWQGGWGREEKLASARPDGQQRKARRPGPASIERPGLGRKRRRAA